MTHVSEHHAKKEGEGDTGIDGWVDFFVRWHSVGIDDLLVHFSKLVCL